MAYMYFLWVGLFFSTVSSASWFAKDRAVLKAQKGDWSGARAQLTRALVDAPDDAATLYDAGVASYKTGDMNQAAAYFKRATEAAACPPSIKEQAYFNWGNTCVQQKELQKALEQYDMTLKLNEKNERARHNRDVVKKMLEQQKQQEKKNQEKQDSDTKKEASDSSQNQQQKDKQDTQQQQKESKEDTQHSSNASQDKQEKDAQRAGQQNQQSDEQKKQSDQHESQNSSGDSSSPQDAQQKNDSGDERTAQQKQDEQEQREGEKQKEQPASGKEKNGEQNAANKREQDSAAQQDGQQEQEASAKHKGKEQKLTGWMAQLLKEQEQRDARVNKQLMQVAVSKKMGGEDGQNCW